MLTNVLTDRVKLQEKHATQGPFGQIETWVPMGDYHARVIPLDVKTIAAYQQLSTVTSHKVLLRGTINVSLGKHRILHGDRVYSPSISAKHYEGITEVICSED